MKGKILKIICIAIIIALLIVIIVQVLYAARKRAMADRIAEVVKKQVNIKQEEKPDIKIISKEEYEQNKDKYDQIDKALQEDEYLMDEKGNYLFDDNGEMIRNTNTLILDELNY